ncbi:cytochrome c oxidase assembly protein COX19-like [Saccoglossus kowalevskii]|uniref:Cytochrome c oxidase assembly protein COX19 n=1 Tax=Saccoglossus kowalevskii TaxID=10224 RepID=A0ABM0GMS4_SACKO|nr:PREDICTED: cytochrome c oxidase assembly protein COX19-like [Saccoglossus kowalevskii]
MSSMNFGQKSFTPRAPAKGSFPLDHDGECKALMTVYMQCLRRHQFENTKCRQQSKEYLECRMDKQLMAKEPLSKLGYSDFEDKKSKVDES